MTIGSPSAQMGNELRTMSRASVRLMIFCNRLIRDPLPYFFRIEFKLNIS